jgi:hypothetical protein
MKATTLKATPIQMGNAITKVHWAVCSVAMAIRRSRSKASKSRWLFMVKTPDFGTRYRVSVAQTPLGNRQASQRGMLGLHRLRKTASNLGVEALADTVVASMAMS